MKVLLSRQSGLFICGTNAFNPLCANYTVSTECLKHACISHVQKHYFGKSPHPLVFYFPDVLAMFLGSVFSFSYLIYSLQPITFLTHILFHSPIAAFFIFFASKRHSTFQSSACSVVLNDSGFTGSPRISDPDGNLFKTPKQKESPLPFYLYSVFPPAWPSICPEAPSCFWWPQEQRAVINQPRCSFPCVVVYSKRMVMPFNGHIVWFQDSECVCVCVAFHPSGQWLCRLQHTWVTLMEGLSC